MHVSSTPSSADDQLFFESVHVSDHLPGLTVSVDERQLFFFSAATYNGHRIHFDRRWATEVEGYPDLVVHGPLQAAIMARFVTDWIGPRGSLLRFSSRNLRVVHPSEQLQFRGTVTHVEPEEDGNAGVVDLELLESSEAGVAMSGSARVRLPHQTAAR